MLFNLIVRDDNYDVKPGMCIDSLRIDDNDEIFVARDSIFLAHDIVEHVNGAHNIGHVWDELEALGALWQVRGRHGDMLTTYSAPYPPSRLVANDIVSMFHNWIGDEGPYTPRQGSHKHDFDEDFDEIIADVAKLLPNETDNHEGIPQYLDLTKRRLRMGFRKAERRYGNYFGGHTLFRNVRDALEPYMKHLEHHQTFQLRWNQNFDVIVKETTR